MVTLKHNNTCIGYFVQLLVISDVLKREVVAFRSMVVDPLIGKEVNCLVRC